LLHVNPGQLIRKMKCISTINRPIKGLAVQLMVVALLLYAGIPEIHAQETRKPDTASEADQTVPELHSPHKATIYSLALPGLGQAYNRKYWKIPVIYAGFGYLGYTIKLNADEMNKFTEAYQYVTSGNTEPTDNEYVIRYPNPNDLLRGRDFYRRKVELHIIYSAAWYILNVLDATVDAHFFDYDISDNLSMRVDPVFLPDRISGAVRIAPATGIRLSLNF